MIFAEEWLRLELSQDLWTSHSPVREGRRLTSAAAEIGVLSCSRSATTRPTGSMGNATGQPVGLLGCGSPILERRLSAHRLPGVWANRPRRCGKLNRL